MPVPKPLNSLSQSCFPLLCYPALPPLQLYVEKARLDAEVEGSFDQMVKSIIDVGDIVGVMGGVKRTEKGELSITATELQV